jgi:hypothetical protein
MLDLKMFDKPNQLLRIFRELKHKLHLIEQGPKTDYETSLIEDSSDQTIHQIRCHIRKRGFADSVNANRSPVRVRIQTPHYFGRSVSKVQSHSKHRGLQMREEQYRAAIQGKALSHSSLLGRSRRHRSPTILAPLQSLPGISLRGQTKSPSLARRL